MNFKPGDRVQYPDDKYVDYERLRGLTGTVLKTFMGESRDVTSVRWDVPIPGGWTCNGLCEHGYGWNVYTSELIPISPQVEDLCGLLDLDLKEVL